MVKIPNAYIVTLDRQGGTGGSSSATATYGAAMPSITVPTRTGYIFGGYYDEANGGGTQYYTAAGASVRSWDKTAATTLYAKWTANTYAVTLDRQGGSGGSSSATATYGAAMPSITVPTRTGYIFGGYYDEANGGGTQYYTAAGASVRSWDKTAATTLYAKWTANTYAVTLDRQGGTGGSSSATATYGSAMPSITLPTRTGYTFDGYYTAANGGGTQYYTASGASARSWDKTAATTLYAKWTANTYAVTLDRQGGSGGSSSVTATYGAAMPSITVPTRTGYTFGGYYDAANGGGTQYYTASGASARNWDKTAATTLYAKWTANTYTVTLDRQGGIGGSSSATATYGSAMPSITVPTRTGYTFGGYYDAANGGGTQYYTAAGASARSWDKTAATTLYAKWTDANGATQTTEYPVPYAWLRGFYPDVADESAAYEAAAVATAANGRKVWECYVAGLDPTKGNEDFTASIEMADGVPHITWWPSNVVGRTYEIWGRTSLSAQNAWETPTNAAHRFFQVRVALAPQAAPQNATITFDSVGGGAVAPITAAVGTALTAPPAPTKQGYVFAGWSPAFPSTMPEGGAVLTAQWTPNTYTVTFNANGGSGSMSNESFTYDTAKTLTANAFARTGYTFAGWATSASGAKAYNDKQSVSNLTATANGTVNLYAKWTPRNYTITFDSAGGSAVASITAAYGSVVTAPTAPTKQGYTFSGWYPAFPATMPLNGATLTAQWTPVNTVDFTWTVSDGAVTITGASGTPTGALVIPATIDGYPVRAIGERAFEECSGVTSVTIPDSVTTIGRYAFYKCSGMTSVTFGTGVTSVGDLAFASCSKLAEVRISDLAAWCGISFDSDYANPCSYAHGLILNGEEITELVIPSGVTAVGTYAFYYCSKLTSVVIPNSVTTIGNHAFYRCSGLTSVAIPSGVTSIGNYAFALCSKVTEISIPGSVTSIGNNVFSSCSELTSISVATGNSVYSSRNGLLLSKDGKTLLEGVNGSVTIPSGVTSIADNAFNGRSKLTSVTIPTGVTNIGEYAFKSCSKLTSITIPSSVESIGEWAFSSCYSLASVSIGNGVTSIGNYAFGWCNKLTSVTIPNSVTSIGNSAFTGCSSLATISIPASLQGQTSNWGLPSGCQVVVRN